MCGVVWADRCLNRRISLSIFDITFSLVRSLPVHKTKTHASITAVALINLRDNSLKGHKDTYLPFEISGLEIGFTVNKVFLLLQSK